MQSFVPKLGRTLEKYQLKKKGLVSTFQKPKAQLAFYCSTGGSRENKIKQNKTKQNKMKQSIFYKSRFLYIWFLNEIQENLVDTHLYVPLNQ